LAFAFQVTFARYIRNAEFIEKFVMETAERSEATASGRRFSAC